MSIETLVAQWSHYQIAPASRIGCIWPGHPSAQPRRLSFLWSGIATQDAAADAARNAAQLTLQTFAKLDGREATVDAELSRSYLLTVPLSDGRDLKSNLTHSIAVAGEPFIAADSEEERSCLDAGEPDYIPEFDDYARAAEIWNAVTRILMVDSVVKRIAIFGGRLIKIQFYAKAEPICQPDGSRLPFKEVGFSIRDGDGMPIQIAEATANAILMIMLRLRGTSCSWELFQPWTLPRRVLIDDVGLSFGIEMQTVLDSPATQLADAIWWLTSMGHLNLAEHVVRMAEEQPEGL